MALQTADGTETVGALLAGWRRRRRVSQLELSLDVGVSTRHLCFVESGRARPSRGLLLSLGRALDLPPRQRNALLLAAGFAPAVPETPLLHPRLDRAIGALVLMLRRHEPWPAIVLDGNWDLVMVNAGWLDVARAVAPEAFAGIVPCRAMSGERPNLLRLLFAPEGFRQVVANWPEVAQETLLRVRHEIGRDADPVRRRLLADIEAGAAAAGLATDEAGARLPDLLMAVELHLGGRTVRLVSTIATLGTAQDITLQDLRIEFFHPLDPPAAAAPGA